MRKLIFLLLVALPGFLYAQIGLKAGANFANVTNASSINNSSRSGFMIGVFLAPSGKGIMTSLTELVYSKQGYNFSDGSKSGKVDLNYIILPQLMGINITKYVQLQLGIQMAYLLNAKADSTTSNGGSMGGQYGSIMSMYNRFDYGFAGGVQVHPYKGLLIGARANISLAKLYKDMQSGQMPSFTAQDAKNNVVQLFLGWRFGVNNEK